MAATAYAAAVSLLNTMDQIQIHPFLSTYFNKYSIESLREKVDIFVDFVEKYSDAESREAEDLLRRIADVAHEAEEIINVEAAHRIRAGSTRKRLSIIMTRKLKKIREEMDCIKEKAMKAKEETGFINPYSLLPPASSSAPPPTATTTENCSDAEDLVRQMEAVALEDEDIFIFQATDQIRAGSINPYSLLPPASSSAPPPTATTTENCSYAEDLVRQMEAVALEDENIFKFQATDQIRAGSTEKSRTMSPMPQREKKVMDSNKEKVVKAKEKTEFLNQQHTSSVPSSSAPPPATAKTTTMVGFDGYLEQLLDQLTGYHSSRRILPIVGMGGIGKTTLATNVYQNSLMLRHFDIRAWITVSQEFTARNIILQALSCLGGYTSNTNTSKSDSQLGEELSKILYGRRYLIVLDDIWSVEAWEKIMFFFPENNNGSRIVVTTRESELVDYFGSSAVVVNFLDEKNSWELFCEKTFAQEGCPHELEEIGKKIVEKCEGLPLAITVFGGLLRKSPRTREYWEKIAKDKSLILESGEGNIKPLSILYLSYKHLPVWLKSCFLYLGLFPEDHEIEVSQLIKLWVAEGFIRSKAEQSLEEVAESYTKELVDRNLLLVGELRINKKLGTCRVHDVVRDLCIRIGEKEKYFCLQRDIDGKCHYIVDEPTARLFYPRETLPSIFCPLIIGRQRTTPFKSRLLRVLFRGDDLEVSGNVLDYYTQLNLRFLYSKDVSLCGILYLMLDSSIHRLWSLQTLIVSDFCNAPREIWEMPQLRHILISGISLPDPPSPTCEDDVIVLHNLQTLKSVENLVLSEEVCERIPNIKELGISYKFNELREASSCYHLHNLGCLNKLESLLLFSWSYPWEYPDADSLPKLKLPSSLKELTLESCTLVWSDMTMIASLPHLQILILQNIKVAIPKWDFVEGVFPSLKHLQIHRCHDLINWSIADNSSFPVLETLSLEYLGQLEEIPSGIGEIPTLERMDVQDCSESAIMSAIEILEEQQSLGNESLQLTLKFFTEGDAVTWRGKIEEMGITCQNLHIVRIMVKKR